MDFHPRHPDTGPAIDAARRRALELRRGAVDEFWIDTEDATRRAWRSTNRLAQSLLRHARLRARQDA
jgi:hypothetical protein